VESRSNGFWSAFGEPDPVTGQQKQLYDATTFATSVSFTSGMHFLRGNDWARDPTTLIQARVAIPRPDFSGAYQPNINNVGEDIIARLAEIDANMAREYVAERGGTPAPRPFTSAADFGVRMRRYRQTQGVERTPQFLDALDRTIQAVVKKKMNWKD
jgi:hypothetical protein